MAAGNTSLGISAARPRCMALIVAAGRGHRFGGDIPKQYLEVGGSSLLHRSMSTFLNHPEIDGVQSVIHPDDTELYDRAVGDLPTNAPVLGGIERQDSVRLGLQSMADIRPERVLIHDAVRPLVTPAVISRVVGALADAVGAVPALAVTDTLKRAQNGMVIDTVPRKNLWHVQTPQGFRYDDILAAHRQFTGWAFTDDAAIAEAMGLPVKLVSGSEANLKVTTVDDLQRVGELLGTGTAETRIGIGYDVHRFSVGNHVTLCGVKVPHDQALEGHSDADVGLHALTDAILGALGVGDIGVYFPPSDPQWKDAPSYIFLEHAADCAAQVGGRIINLDLTLICESPKIGPHRQEMRHKVAEILRISVDRINIKATTTERLGFIGRGEGIAAQAIASVKIITKQD